MANPIIMFMISRVSHVDIKEKANPYKWCTHTQMLTPPRLLLKCCKLLCSSGRRRGCEIMFRLTVAIIRVYAEAYAY